MPEPKFYFLIIIAGIILFSCDRAGETPTAIRDFSPALQPYLKKAVATAMVGYDSATKYIQTHATDQELRSLAKSEHPILRSIAFTAILSRRSFDHFQVIMTHLNDTALILVDHGEWGGQLDMVSDHLIAIARWKSDAEKNRTVDAVILHHDYLRSAYSILSKIGPDDRYYPHIKAMAQREVAFQDKEEALYALARYKKKNDISLIQEALLTHLSRLREKSFRLMEDFPDSSYVQIFEAYYPRRFYGSICREHYTSPADAFISVVASYKTDHSARILEAILNRRPFLPCVADSNYLKEHVLLAIWANPCSAYSKISAKIRMDAEKQHLSDSLNTISIPYDSSYAIKDTSAEPVRW